MAEIQLLTGPLGTDFTGALLDKVDRTDPFVREVLAVGRDASNAVTAKAASESLPVQVFPIHKLIEELGQKYNMPRPLNPVITQLAVAQVLKEDPSGYRLIGSNARQPDMAAGPLAKALDEVFMAGADINMLQSLGRKDLSSKITEDKFADMALAAKRIEERLERKGFALGSRLYARIADKLIGQAEPVIDDLFIDALPAYDALTIKMIQALASSAKNVTIALPAGAGSEPVYAQAQELIRALNKCPGKKPVTVPLESGNVNPAAQAVFSRKPVKPISSLSLHEAGSLDEEVGLAASHIQQLIETGVSAEDILVTGTNTGEWIDALNTQLEQRGIRSIHFGRKLNIGRVAGYLGAMMDLVQDLADGTMRSDHFLRFISYDFQPFKPETKDTLRKFYTHYGPDVDQALITGEEDNERAVDFVRKKTDEVREALMPLAVYARNPHTITEWTAALLEFFKDISLTEQFHHIYNDFSDKDEAGAESLVDQWSGINRIILMVDDVLGDKTVALAEYMDVLDRLAANSSSHQLGTGSQAVQIDSLAAAGGRRPKHLLVMDASSTVMPPAAPAGFLGHRERQTLSANGIEVSDPSKMADLTRQQLGSAIANAQDSVWIAWKTLTPANEQDYPSELIMPLVESLPASVTTDSLTKEEEDFRRRLMDLESEADPAKFEQKCAELADEYANEPARLERLERAAMWMTRQFGRIDADKKKVAEAFGDGPISVTRIESYATCPLSHFIERVMKAKELNGFEITPADRGSFYHAVLAEVLMEYAKDPQNFDEGTIDAAIEENMPAFLKRVAEQDPASHVQKEALIEDLGSAIAKNIDQLRLGSFMPEATELELKDFSLELPDGRTVELSGIIDRIDTYTDDNGEKYCRIIDYKTGGKKLSREDVEKGLQLQLPLYMKALCEKDAGSHPGGLYYSGVRPQMAQLTDPGEPGKPDSKYKANALSGFTNDAVYGAMDRNLEGEPNYTSPVLGFKTKKDGTLSKVGSSSNVPESELDDLMNTAIDTAAKKCEEMLEGETDASKVIDRSRRCQFCAYRSFCHSALDRNARPVLK